MSFPRAIGMFLVLVVVSEGVQCIEINHILIIAHIFVQANLIELIFLAPVLAAGTGGTGTGQYCLLPYPSSVPSPILRNFFWIYLTYITGFNRENEVCHSS